MKKKSKQKKFIYPKIKEKRYGLLCLSCGKVMVSYHRHDYKTCGCENETMVDGGSDYFRYGTKDFTLIQCLEISPMEEDENESKN